MLLLLLLLLLQCTPDDVSERLRSFLGLSFDSLGPSPPKKNFAKNFFFEKLPSHGGSFAAVSMNFCILSSLLGRSRRDLDVPPAKKKVSALHDTKILVAKLKFLKILHFDLIFSTSTVALLLGRLHFLGRSRRDLPEYERNFQKFVDVQENEPVLIRSTSFVNP